MTTDAAISRKHVWISNAAFSRMTGTKKVCMVCGQPNTTAPRECSGERSKP